MIITICFMINAHEHEADSQLWQSIQRGAKNTVVQIFAQVVKVDLLQPYKAPEEYSFCWKWFFH